jgi:hypothetical protein
MSSALYMFGGFVAFIGFIKIMDNYTEWSLLLGIIMLGTGGVIMYGGYLTRGLDK